MIKLRSVRVIHACWLLLGLLLLNSQIVSAQNITATGKVVDVNGEPMIGVSVALKGAGKGTITDLDGNFRLEVDNKAVIVFLLSDIKYRESSQYIEECGDCIARRFGNVGRGSCSRLR